VYSNNNIDNKLDWGENSYPSQPNGTIVEG